MRDAKSIMIPGMLLGLGAWCVGWGYSFPHGSLPHIALLWSGIAFVGGGLHGVLRWWAERGQ